jgi:hypothetical protein
MSIVILLEVWVMLRVLLLMCILMIELVHPRHSSAARSTVDAAMLPLMTLGEHAAISESVCLTSY